MAVYAKRRSLNAVWTLCLLAVSLAAACGEIRRPKMEPYVAKAVPPPKQELRWSNGKMPKSLDPADALAAPETDVIRAVYEGLTELDGRTLNAEPGVAERWEVSEDGRTWTFHLRKDARWSNGERVTASDFVRSWRRLSAKPELASRSFLFHNIVGMQEKSLEEIPATPSDFLNDAPIDPDPLRDGPEFDEGSPLSQGSLIAATPEPPASEPQAPEKTSAGVVAIDDATLAVTLLRPDKDFPKLVAHPIFRPVYDRGKARNAERLLDPSVVTNGAFKVAGVAADGLSLERSDSYWNKGAVALEKVKFVAAGTAETALEAYKNGEVDVVTNALFEPVGLKLLAPYEDFQRRTHAALNLYEFNMAKPPFDDRRVREALTIGIDRAKLADGDLEGTTEPANRFLPLGDAPASRLSFDAVKAKELLEVAGFPDGRDFPVVRLVVNRNNTQQRVARSVARMWKQNLNIDTEIVVKESSEMESVRETRDFDLVRRGVVLTTSDELVNLATIFGVIEKPGTLVEGSPPAAASRAEDPANAPLGPDKIEPRDDNTFTQEDALFELRAMPLYFPSSFSLVKPYVLGFETNGLDAPSLKETHIDSNWRR